MDLSFSYLNYNSIETQPQSSERTCILYLQSLTIDCHTFRGGLPLAHRSNGNNQLNFSSEEKYLMRNSRSLNY